jgi:hypothetical protein
MYKVAIPSYKRETVLSKKSLNTLIKGKVPPSKIFIFVANNEEKKNYETVLDKKTYNKIIIGKKGIANQRKFIKNYFKEGEYIVSIDDDVESVLQLKKSKLVELTNLNSFFIDAFNKLKKEGLYIWGIYPVRNDFFMKTKKPITTDLKFIIGVLYGFIVRHDKSLEPSTKSEGKEDYEQSILYYKKDGGVLRFNHITTKTKFLAKGGLGEEKKRFEINKKAAAYLNKKYPEFITIFHRKNGMTEVKLSVKSNNKTKKNKTKNHKKPKTKKLK